MSLRIALSLVVVVYACILPRIAAGGSNSGHLSPLNCRPFADKDLPKAVPQNDPEAMERFQLINREANAGSHPFLFLGDSLTQKWDPSLWAWHFASLNALNAGVNGDRTEHLLWRIEHGNIDHQRPEMVVLLIGTNDIGRNRPAKITAEGVRQILWVLRSQLPSTRILLLGVLPRSELASSERRHQVNEVNQLIRTCADDKHVFYVNVGNALLDEAGRLTREISPDGVHLSKQGYKHLTDQLESQFGKMPSWK